MYVSQMQGELGSDQVEAIGKAAAAHNLEQGVTGLLVSNTAGFMQLLEGSSADVLTLMHRIEADTRHTAITYIRNDARARRECPDWSMRTLTTPFNWVGAAEVFASELPSTMEPDTKLLFTSFASSLKAEDPQAA